MAKAAVFTGVNEPFEIREYELTALDMQGFLY